MRTNKQPSNPGRPTTVSAQQTNHADCIFCITLIFTTVSDSSKTQTRQHAEFCECSVFLKRRCLSYDVCFYPHISKFIPAALYFLFSLLIWTSWFWTWTVIHLSNDVDSTVLLILFWKMMWPVDCLSYYEEETNVHPNIETWNVTEQKKDSISSAESAGGGGGGRRWIHRKRQRRGNCCVLVLITSQQNCWSFHQGTLAGWSNVFLLRVSVLLRPVSASLRQTRRDANPSSSVTAAALCANHRICRETHTHTHTHTHTLLFQWVCWDSAIF